jgi:hypothetical protein
MSMAGQLSLVLASNASAYLSEAPFQGTLTEEEGSV